MPKVKKNVTLPREFQWQEIPEASLSPLAQSFFKTVDAGAAPLFFQPILNFQMLGYRIPTEIRLYYNDQAATGLLASIFRAAQPLTVFEFTTRFADDSEVDTSNSQMSGVFRKPAWVLYERFPGVTDLRALFEKHRARVEARKIQGFEPRFQPLAKLMDEIKRSQDRQVQYQVEQGAIRLDQAASLYRPANPMAFKGIGNFINPLANDFTLPRLLLGLGLGLGLTLGGVWLADFIGWLDHLRQEWPSFTPARIALLAYAPGFVLAGLAVGWVFPRKGLLWGFLISIPAALSLPNEKADPILFSLLTALSGHIANTLVAPAASGERFKSAATTLLYLAALIVFGLVRTAW
jgi:hypothetical protein